MKVGSGVILGVILSAAPMVSVVAAEHRPYVGIGGGIVLDDGERFSNEGGTYGVQFGQRIHGNWGLEGSLFGTDFGRRVGDWSELGAKAEVLYHLSSGGAWDPYLAAGAGYVRSKERTLNFTSNDPFATLGLGVIRNVQIGGRDLGLRADYRFRMMDLDDAAGIPGAAFDPFEEHIFTAGFVLPIGKAAEKAPEAVVDSDGDGVPDDKDACPNTPAGVVVDARGCPLDSDGDGVPDYLDKCPDTKPGVATNKEGCPIDQVGANREFETVNFAFDRSDLNARAQTILDEASKVIVDLQAKHGGLVIQIDGHTDSIGSPGYNQGLSERRANAVKDYLTRKGVDAKRIETRAFGLTKPVATNDTSEGRAQNRRAEVRTRAPE